jgi:hypothetical protein
MKQIKNNHKSIGKSHASQWILKISRKKKSTKQKSQDFRQIFVISNKKLHKLGFRFKNI